MKLNLITIATVKAQLGILTATTTYDAQITAMIPIVSNDVRRILNCDYSYHVFATITSGSAEVTMKSGFNMGQVVYSASIPDDTYLESYDYETGIYTLSANATATDTYLYPTIEIGMFPAISKMIFYKIGKAVTGSAELEIYKSVSYGNVSKSFTDDEINKKFDYPSIYINELGTQYQKVG